MVSINGVRIGAVYRVVKDKIKAASTAAVLARKLVAANRATRWWTGGPFSAPLRSSPRLAPPRGSRRGRCLGSATWRSTWRRGIPGPAKRFSQALRDFGYVEGQNLAIEYRDARGQTDRFPALAAELAALKPDVIVTGGGTLGALAVKRATATVPIVFGAVGDPVSEGIVASLSRPGGNITGLAVLSTETLVKTVELLTKALGLMIPSSLLQRADQVIEWGRPHLTAPWSSAADDSMSWG
jgi:hypothetical protein